jgi:membrane protease YdiL (CAAX protease family)
VTRTPLSTLQVVVLTIAVVAGSLLISGVVALMFSGVTGVGGQLDHPDTRLFQAALQAVLMGIGGIALHELWRLPGRRTDEFGAPEPLAILVALGLIAGFAGLMTSPLARALVGDHEIAVTDPLGWGRGTGQDLVIVVLVCGVIPLGEELLFRGALLPALRRADGAALAVVGSALVFGLAHLTTGVHAALSAGLLGLFLGTAAVIGRSLVAPVLGHGVNNALALSSLAHGHLPVTVALIAVPFATAALVAPRWWSGGAPGGQERRSAESGVVDPPPDATLRP